MSAIIYETDVPVIIDLLRKFHTLDERAVPSDLDADEIALISKHRREKIARELQNKGITIRPLQFPAAERSLELDER